QGVVEDESGNRGTLRPVVNSRVAFRSALFDQRGSESPDRSPVADRTRVGIRRGVRCEQGFTGVSRWHNLSEDGHVPHGGRTPRDVWRLTKTGGRPHRAGWGEGPKNDKRGQ